MFEIFGIVQIGENKYIIIVSGKNHNSDSCKIGNPNQIGILNPPVRSITPLGSHFRRTILSFSKFPR
jgi:hypothetical protein